MMQTFWNNKDTLEPVPRFVLSWVWQELEYQWDVCRAVNGPRASFTNSTHKLSQYLFFFCVYGSNHGKSANLDRLTVTPEVTIEWVALVHHIWEIPGSNPAPETSCYDWDVLHCSLVSQSKCQDSTTVRQWLLPSTSPQVIIHYWAPDSS